MVKLDANTPLTGVTMVSSLYTHAMALTDQGEVWVWGNNANGQLGDGTYNNSYYAKRVMDGTQPLSGITAVAAGARHSLALDENENIWGWGHNVTGQLGDGTTTSTRVPVQSNALSNVIALAAGYGHSTAVLADHSVWTWGDNDKGQLGYETELAYRSVPEQVFTDALVTIPQVSAGHAHTVLLKENGTVWAWGSNAYGEGGVDPAVQTTPVTLTQIPELSDIVKISAGYDHNLALKKDGTVWGWRRNNNGSLGDNTLTHRATAMQVKDSATTYLTGIIDIAAGQTNSIALKRDGTVMVWGYNASGQLGNGTTTHSLIAIPLSGMTNAKAVAVGQHCNFILKKDGTVYALGQNNYGQLGNGTTTSSLQPVQVMINATTPLTNIDSISVSFTHVLALTKEGTVWAWGSNDSGQLGDNTQIGSSYAKQVMNGAQPLSGIVSVETGFYNGFALAQDGTLWDWGSNGNGRLGDGTKDMKKIPSQGNKLNVRKGIANVASGGYHGAALLENGEVWSFGSNGSLQLSNGTTTESIVPIRSLTELETASPITLIGNVNTSKAPYARNVWDMQEFDGKIYLGHGDFGKNAGPIPVVCIDSATNLFTTEYTALDEEIWRLNIIGDSLYIPGCDPRESQNLGNLYIKTSGAAWVKKRTIPGGIHTFDVAEYDNKLWVGVGAHTGYTGATAIQSSADGGNTWSMGLSVQIPERVYTALTSGGSLFGITKYSRYDGRLILNGFKITAGQSLPSAETTLSTTTGITGPELINGRHYIIKNKFNFDNHLVFSMLASKTVSKIEDLDGFYNPGGVYYATSFPTGINRITLPESEALGIDTFTKEGAVYILAYIENSESDFTNIVYKTTDLVNVTEVLRFDYGSFARSFEKITGEDEYFFGIGSKEVAVPSALSGDIIRVSLASKAIPKPSNNALLTFIHTSSYMSPGFTSNNTNYTVQVAKDVTSVNLIPALSDSAATVSGGGLQANLVAGTPRIVTITVTAEDGFTTKTYTVTINRDAP